MAKTPRHGDHPRRTVTAQSLTKPLPTAERRDASGWSHHNHQTRLTENVYLCPTVPARALNHFHRMDIDILQWIGYTASAIIAISMTMSSIVKFRVINLIGASLFCTYGILIDALPVALLNGFIVVVDIYYLHNIFSRKEVFDIMRVRNDNKYLKRFLDFYRDDIQRFFPGFTHRPELNSYTFFILRDMAVAGILLARREEGEVLHVILDYVKAEYRDFKNGKFIFHRLQEEMIREGFTKVVTEGHTPIHKRYLRKLGFKQTGEDLFELRLCPSRLEQSAEKAKKQQAEKKS